MTKADFKKLPVFRQQQPSAATGALLRGLGWLWLLTIMAAVAGWRRLREVLGNTPHDRALAILTPLYTMLGPIHPGSRRFWDELVRTAPDTTTVRELAVRLSITPSTWHYGGGGCC